jgi:sigma-B regulation protein RsbU (phosphoserine phosphatase)
MRVLIAEDDRVTARLLSEAVRSWGYDVIAATDGREALAALEADDPPQLALLDWMLPGLDGPEVCRMVRSVPRLASTYLILVTSKNARADVVAGLQAGADEYLVKPVDHEELRARLHAGGRIVDLQQRLGDQVRELEAALTNIRKLTGLLPICAYCKSIRDDSNYWHRVEEYVTEHSGATFSHGICPKCLPEVEKQMALEDEHR